MEDSPEDHLDKIELRLGMEPLTPDEKEAFLARVRAQGRALTSAEQYALFGPPPAPAPPKPVQTAVSEMEPAQLDGRQIARLQADFFPELGELPAVPSPRLVQCVIFDFDYTLADLARPLADLMAEGARAAEAYLRSTGMKLPDDFHTQIVEARRFAERKSEEEQEEHIADDAMSFLLQFYGYPASRLDPAVLQRAVDIFYAPEMTAWRLRPQAREVLQRLHTQGYKLAVLANYNCDRVFQRTIDYLGIRPYLDVCLCSASVEYRKPDEKLFQIVLDRWDALPYEVVVVGDSLPHDIRGGIEAGMLTVQVKMGSSPQVEHDNAAAAAQIAPDAVVDDLGALPALIHAWAHV